MRPADRQSARDRRIVEAFLRDTRTLSALRHPHLLPIYEAAEHGNTAIDAARANARSRAAKWS